MRITAVTSSRLDVYMQFFVYDIGGFLPRPHDVCSETWQPHDLYMRIFAP